MTLQEAIKKIDPLTKDAGWIVDPDLKQALLLAIECAKWRLHQEEAWHPTQYPPLPGQTRGD